MKSTFFSLKSKPHDSLGSLSHNTNHTQPLKSLWEVVGTTASLLMHLVLRPNRTACCAQYTPFTFPPLNLCLYDLPCLPKSRFCGWHLPILWKPNAPFSRKPPCYLYLPLPLLGAATGLTVRTPWKQAVCLSPTSSPTSPGRVSCL